MLNSFNSIVLNVAVVALIIVLIVIGVAINNSVRGSKVQFPPVTGACPDYWSASDIPGGSLCSNDLVIGNGNLQGSIPGLNQVSTLSSNSMCTEFVTASVPTTCDKFNLATSCQVTWDGITNNTDNRSKCM
jgi:hypothetical protein